MSETFKCKALVCSALVSLSFAPNAAVAQDATSKVCMPETKVYYGNGVRTEFEAASRAMKDLEAAYKASLEDLRNYHPEYADEVYTFDMAYNPTVGALKDLAEVMLQKADEKGANTEGLSGIELLEMVFMTDEARSTFVRGVLPQLVADVSGDDADYSSLEDPALYDDLRLEYQEYVGERLGELDATEASLAQQYQRDIQSGRRVIVLAHSQGNLFANSTIEAVRAADPDNANMIGMYGVASPASYEISGSDYVTAHDDFIIDSLRLVQGNVLPSNLDNDPGVFGDFRSWSRHGFLRDYFDPRLRSRGRIDAGLENLALGLEFPSSETRRYPFTGDLASGFDALHVDLEFLDFDHPDAADDYLHSLDIQINTIDGETLYPGAVNQVTPGRISDYAIPVQFYTLPHDEVVEGFYIIGASHFGEDYVIDGEVIYANDFDRRVKFSMNIGDDTDIPERTEILDRIDEGYGNYYYETSLQAVDIVCDFSERTYGYTLFDWDRELEGYVAVPPPDTEQPTG